MRFLAIMLLFSGSLPAACPTTGVIRWDGWVGAPNDVGAWAEAALGPAQFHYRLPWYGVETGPDQVLARCITQACEDRQNAQAAMAGLDYWAFVWYPSSSGLNTGFNLYLSSARADKPRYCLILDANFWKYSSPADLKAHFMRPSYLRVLGRRPLLYLLGPANLTQPQVRALREAGRAAGLGVPYIVLMRGEAADVQAAASLKLDALSLYAVTWKRGGVPYADLAKEDRVQWNWMREQGLGVVPNVTTGWDNRPVHVRPAPWYPDPGPDHWVQQADPGQIALHIKQAREWTLRWPKAAVARTVIVYAWNEYAEGGWISPMLKDGSRRLDAIGAVLKDCPEDVFDSR